MMDDSSKSALPLFWILDVLARSQLQPLSLLIDLSSQIPKSSEDAVNNLREVVSLRILEYIYALQPNSSLSTTTISIDPTKHSCVYVLQLIMKNSGFNFKAAPSEMSKWDIQPFLKHKKDSFPNSILLKIKDAILKGNPPHLASLRKQSGLPQPQPRPPVVAGDCNNATIAPNSTQIPSEKDHLISPVPAQTKIVEERSCKQPITQEGNVIKSAEKHKPQPQPRPPLVAGDRNNATIAPNSTQIPSEKYHLISPVPAQTKIVEERSCKQLITQEGNVIKSAEKHKPPTIHSDKRKLPHSINKSNGQSSQNYTAANANGYRKVFSATDKNERLRQENQGQHENGQTANVNLDEPDQETQTNVSNATKAEKRESCIASGRHNEQMTDIAKKKEAFLSSQCTLSQDSLSDSFSDCELMLCVKCNKGENVLVCSNSCAVVIHESCMVSGASFDKDGKFYCPFCAFSRALSKYKEIKTKVSAARNEFSKFLSSGSRKKTEKQSTSQYNFNQVDGLLKKTGLKRKAGSRKETEKPSTSQNNLNQVEGLPKKTDLKSKAIFRGKLYREMAGPSEAGLPSKGKEVASTNGTPCTRSNHKQVKKRTRQVTHSPRVTRQRQTREQSILKSQNERAVHEISERSDEVVKINSKKGVSGPTETDLHCENKNSASDDSANEEEISECSSDKSFDPEDDVRVIDKRSLVRAQKRRIRWTSEEEDKLEEAMKSLCVEENTIIPWTKILEYGADTFHGRTSMQLKDKWRNMCKRANKQ